MALTIIGFDISTTTIGVAVIISKNGASRLKHHEYYKPPKDGTIFERLIITKRWFLALIDKYKPNEIAIEEFIQYMAGGSGAKTIIPLALFNTTLGLVWYELTGREPHILNVMKIRHTLKFSKELPGKEEMPVIVSKYLGIDFPWYKDTKEKKPRKKIAKPKKEDKSKTMAKELGILIESFDVADAMAVALAYLKIKKGK